MADTKILEIAEKLLKRTRNGEVNWRETVDSNEFIVSFPTQTLAIEETVSGRYQISLVNERGNTIESLRFPGSQAIEGGEILQDLFELARRKALQIDIRLDEALNALDQEGPIGSST